MDAISIQIQINMMVIVLELKECKGVNSQLKTTNLNFLSENINFMGLNIES